MRVGVERPSICKVFVVPMMREVSASSSLHVSRTHPIHVDGGYQWNAGAWTVHKEDVCEAWSAVAVVATL